MKTEPSGKRRTCALRSCSKKIIDLARKYGDPFCSSKCCRAYYGVVFKSDDTESKGPQPLKVLPACHKCKGPRIRNSKGRIRCTRCERELSRKQRERDRAKKEALCAAA